MVARLVVAAVLLGGAALAQPLPSSAVTGADGGLANGARARGPNATGTTGPEVTAATLDGGVPSPIPWKSLMKRRAGEVVTVHLAPVAVSLSENFSKGTMYPEPCDPKDKAIWKDGRAAPGLVVYELPGAMAKELNALANAQTEGERRWSCFDVTMRLSKVAKTKRVGAVDGTFLSATARGSRKVDPSLLAGD